MKTFLESLIEEVTDVIERKLFDKSVVKKMDEISFKSTYILNKNATSSNLKVQLVRLNGRLRSPDSKQRRRLASRIAGVL